MYLAISPLLIVCLLAIAALAMQDAPPTTAQIMGTPAQPTYSTTLPDECNVVDVLWSDDSSRAYAAIDVSAVDLWPLLVRFWPEIASGGLSFILLLTMLVMLWRRWRRWRVGAIGEPHCARCSYQLTGRTDATVCPECGRPLGKGGIILGRRLRRWPVVLTATLLVLVAGGYVVGRNHVPRKGTASTWLHWPSARFYTWATNRKYWSLIGIPTGRIRIVEIDPVAGRASRTAFDKPARQRDGEQWRPRIYRAADAGHFYLMGKNAVAEIEMGSGKTVRLLRLPPEYAESRIGLTDLAIHPSKPVLYAYVDYGIVGAWDLGSGDWTQLQVYPTRSQLLMYSLFALEGADTVILRRALDQRAVDSGFDFIDLSTLETVLSQREPKHDLSQVIGAAHGELLYTVTEFGGVAGRAITEQSILRWAPGMAEAETMLTLPLSRICEIERPRRTSRIYISGYPVASGPQLPIVAVFDPATSTYLQPLESPFRGDMNLAVSPDERWAITWHPEPTTGPALFIFDLQAIHGDAPGK